MKIMVPVLIVAIITAGVLLAMLIGARSANRNNVNPKYRTAANQAHVIFRDMMFVRNPEEMDLLTEESKNKILKWQNDFGKIY